MPWMSKTLTTPRLALRAYTDADASVIIEMITSPDIRRYLGGPAAADFAARVASGLVGEFWGAFCIADSRTDKAIGGCSLDRHRGELELSYELLPGYWGRGLAFEAVSVTIDWVWRHTDDSSLIAVTQSANAASVALLLRLRFDEVDRFEEFGAPQTMFRLSRP